MMRSTLAAPLALCPLALALALVACGEEPQAPEGEPYAISTADDALATDTSVLPPQDTTGSGEALEPEPEPGPIMTAPVEQDPPPPPAPAAT